MSLTGSVVELTSFQLPMLERGEYIRMGQQARPEGPGLGNLSHVQCSHKGQKRGILILFTHILITEILDRVLGICPGRVCSCQPPPTRRRWPEHILAR